MSHQITVDATVALEGLGGVVADAILVTDHYELAAALSGNSPILVADPNLQATLFAIVQAMEVARKAVVGLAVVGALTYAAHIAIKEHYAISVEAPIDLTKWGIGIHGSGKVVLTPPPQ